MCVVVVVVAMAMESPTCSWSDIKVWNFGLSKR